MEAVGKGSKDSRGPGFKGFEKEKAGGMMLRLLLLKRVLGGTH